MRASKIKLLACGSAAVVVAAAAMSWAAEGSDALRAAPAAVQSAVIQLAGTNKINDFDSEVENGKTVYDLEFSVKGVSYEADIDAAGAILSREVEVDLGIVPPTVMDAAKKAHADGKVHEASIVNAGDKLYYELDVKVGKDNHEVQIGADGAVIADSIEAPEPGEAAEAGEKNAEKGEKEDKD